LVFDKDVRKCFEELSGLHPDDRQWLQATLASKLGGLGLRSARAHGDAAYLASRSSCHGLCAELDPQHKWEVTDPQSAAAGAVRSFNEKVSPCNRVPPLVPEKLKQQTLSKALDTATLEELKATAGTDLPLKAHYELLQEPSAGAWLLAVPNQSFGNAVAPPLFTTDLQRRLRMKVRCAPCFCPFCDGVCDEYGDHDLVCCGGGDRTKRHNLLRNQGCRLAAAAGLNPELEKPNLLRPRPQIGSLEENGTRDECPRDTSGRRPADVYAPRWYLGGPAAFDFAVTSGLRADLVSQSARDGSAATTAYEAHKRSFLDTAALCEEEGLTFIPMVMEAHGGSWGLGARRAWAQIAKAAAQLTGDPPAAIAERHLQRLSTILHRENARTIARRSAGAIGGSNQTIEAARTVLVAAAAERAADM
jgi:hypothetical protein